MHGVGVVVQDVHRAEPLDGRVDETVHLVLDGEVDAVRERHTAGGFDLGGDRSDTVLVQVGGDDRGAERRAPPRARPPHPRRGTGDDDHLALQRSRNRLRHHDPGIPLPVSEPSVRSNHNGTLLSDTDDASALEQPS